MTTATKSNLPTKLLTIIEEIGVVEKKGHNKEHNYDFLQAVDLLNAVRPLALKHGVLFLPSATRAADTASKSGTPIANLDGQLAIIDVDDPGNPIVLPFVASGMDTQDKGPYKALTTGIKYALRSVLMVADEADDVERDAAESPTTPPADPPSVVGAGGRTINDKQRAKLAARTRELGIEPGTDAFKGLLRTITGKESSKELTNADLDRVFENLAEFKVPGATPEPVTEF